MSSQQENYIDGALEKALRRALKVVNKCSEADITNGTKLLIASNLAPVLVEIEMEVFEHKDKCEGCDNCDGGMDNEPGI